MKAGIDQDALIRMFSEATAKQGEQLRSAVYQTTLRALQGRELTLQNIRGVLKTVTQAASAGAAQNAAAGIDPEDLLAKAVEGMDDALLQAVEANRVALQRLADQGADLRDKHLKKALSDLEKMEDALLDSVGKAAEAASGQLAGAWGPILEKMKMSGTGTGAQASATVEQMSRQMRDAVRSSRAAGLRAAQALAESYGALVSGVLIGMSDALQQGGPGKAAAAAKSARRK